MGEGKMSAEEAQLKGLSKHFNSVTITGRANVAKLTYAVMAGIGIWIWSKPKKSSSAGAKGPPTSGKKQDQPLIPAGSYRHCD